MIQTYSEKISKWLFSAFYPLGTLLILYFTFNSMVLDIFYLIDGYEVEGYVTYTNFITDREYEQEIVDINGNHYTMRAILGKRNIKEAQEANATGQKVIIRRSKFLDKWNFWEKGKLTGKVVFKDFLIILFSFTMFWVIYSDIKKKFNTKKTPPAG